MSQLLRGNLLVRKPWNIGALAGVLDGNPANVAVSVNIQQSVLVQIPGLGDLGFFKLDVERVSILEISDLHGPGARSKKARLGLERQNLHSLRYLLFELSPPSVTSAQSAVPLNRRQQRKQRLSFAG